MYVYYICLVRRVSCTLKNGQITEYALKIPRTRIDDYIDDSFSFESEITKECPNNEYTITPVEYDGKRLLLCSLFENIFSQPCKVPVGFQDRIYPEEEKYFDADKGLIKIKPKNDAKCILFKYASEGSIYDMIDKDVTYFVQTLMQTVFALNYLKFLEQTALGLQSLGECGVIHRDVRLPNLWLHKNNENYSMHVGDFGIATKEKDCGDTVKDGVTIDPNNELIETAPEIIIYQTNLSNGKNKQEQPYDRRADVFSLGASFVMLLTYFRGLNYPTLSNWGDEKVRSLVNYEKDTDPKEKVKVMKYYLDYVITAERLKKHNSKLSLSIELLKKMIEFDPVKRISIDTVVTKIQEIIHSSDTSRRMTLLLNKSGFLNQIDTKEKILKNVCTKWTYPDHNCIPEAMSTSYAVKCTNDGTNKFDMTFTIKMQRMDETTSLEDLQSDTLSEEYNFISNCKSDGNFIKPLYGVEVCDSSYFETRNCFIQNNINKAEKFKWNTTKHGGMNYVTQYTGGEYTDSNIRAKCLIYPDDLTSLPNVWEFFTKKNEEGDYENGVKVLYDNLFRWYIQMATAVSSLHSCNVQHNDIRLENFLVKRNATDNTYDIFLSGYDLAIYNDKRNDKKDNFIKMDETITKPAMTAGVSRDMWMLGVAYAILLYIPLDRLENKGSYLLTDYQTRKYENENERAGDLVWFFMHKNYNMSEDTLDELKRMIMGMMSENYPRLFVDKEHNRTFPQMIKIITDLIAMQDRISTM
eukprot:GHVR01011922.1.p1 GENE.GHVR01011922.1~~GHVR01011922.1.p1  ORF type:complete len:758 (+),score=128.71 GHVR01011922.1:27-2276(+)